ncbi:MAG: 3-deoxy-D-manno-octulosonic acid transferase [Epsilonproteobacteria bacterium]|nr:MAG: 3-deoxy-D-manno-octulosonic acid transferase [Campylobacterota bacterium]
MKLFTLFYTVVAGVLYLLALPFLLLYIFKAKYSKSLPARFFLWRNPPLSPDGIWIHSCSFGEARAIRPLIKAIPPSLLRLTSTTHTGFGEIQKQTQESRYLPYELLLYIWMRPQKMLLVMEAELWYLLFFLARRKRTKTLLVNARMNERSFPKYLRLKWLYRRIFAQIDTIYAQTDADKDRLEQLGAHTVTVTGNIKFADIEKPTEVLEKPKGLLVCAGSTHEGEESLILGAFKRLKNKQSDAKLIIAPRHPERFEKVYELIVDYARLQGWTQQRYSLDRSLSSDIILVDSLGELINLYAVSDVVVLGGAFEPIGGHNAAEVAQFGCKIISGEHYFNQKDIFAGIEGIKVVKKDLLAEVLQHPKLLPQSRIKRKVDLGSIIHEIEKMIKKDKDNGKSI